MAIHLKILRFDMTKMLSIYKPAENAPIAAQKRLIRLTLIVPRAWEIGYTQPCIKCQGKSATHFVYFWSRNTLPYTHLEATSYIPQQGQSLHIWTTSLSTTDCYKNKYTMQFLWMACISRFATAILSSETELALCTIRVNILFLPNSAAPRSRVSFSRVTVEFHWLPRARLNKFILIFSCR